MTTTSERDRRVDRLLSEGVTPDWVGRWLVVGDLPEVERALAEVGAEAVGWTRFVRPGRVPTAAPAGEGYQGAVVRLPRGSAAIRCALHLVAARLVPEGALWVGGANDEGIRSVEKGALAEVISEPSPAVSGGHARRIGGSRPRPGLRGALEQWEERVVVEVDGAERALVSYPGLFAHGRLDPGTALLLAKLPPVAGARVLDFATGAGVVAAVVAERGASAVDACDHDALAISAARRNAPAAQVHLADGVPAGRWDRIVSNPPIHRGAELDWSVLEGLAAALPRALTPGGSLVAVTQVTVPMRRLFAGCRITLLGSDGGFAVHQVSPG